MASRWDEKLPGLVKMLKGEIFGNWRSSLLSQKENGLLNLIDKDQMNEIVLWELIKGKIVGNIPSKDDILLVKRLLPGGEELIVEEKRVKSLVCEADIVDKGGWEERKWMPKKEFDKMVKEQKEKRGRTFND